jgi:uncharacterized phage protein gp47/JayE
MAKKSMVNREVKRAKLVQKHAAKRAALKTVIYDQTKSIECRKASSAGKANLNAGRLLSFRNRFLKIDCLNLTSEQ